MPYFRVAGEGLTASFPDLGPLGVARAPLLWPSSFSRLLRLGDLLHLQLKPHTVEGAALYPLGLVLVCSPQAHHRERDVTCGLLLSGPVTFLSLLRNHDCGSPESRSQGCRCSPRALCAQRAGRLFSILNDFFHVGVEPAHSMSKIYSTEKRQKIGKA